MNHLAGFKSFGLAVLLAYGNRWGVAQSLPGAQPDSLTAPATRFSVSAETGGIVGSTGVTPFWLRANQFGVVPLTSPAGIIRVGSTGRLTRNPHQRLAFTYGLDVAGNVAQSSRIVLPEAYLRTTFKRMEVYAGRRKEVMGLVDTLLSSGSYAWSGNALPVTKVQIGTQGFAPLRFTNGLIAINGFFAHGWLANTDSIQGAYLHQKALYGRIGRPNWKVKLYGGVVHNVQWGGRSDYVSPLHAVNGRMPASFKDYVSLVLLKRPGQSASDTYTSHDGLNQFGNHLGSIDIAAEVDLSGWSVLGYYQHAYEDKSGIAFVNFPDGLYGLRLKNKALTPIRHFRLTQLLLECLTTMDQSGPYVFQGTHYDGQDDYFNNYQYLDGWSQDRRVIGTPFLSRRADIQAHWRDLPIRKWAIANNRVQMVHAGLSGQFASGVQVQAKLSYSNNYGTYRAPFSESASQFSGAVWLTWPLRWLGGSELRSAVAVDQGTLYNNTFGGWLSIRKTWKK